ncbi:hypothetical protein, partial [Rhodopirellula bahusiensis]|uniref:hypothetical protein n=1 Tax=Rhodopirellula bahusiensis TaxID=2014065 RepID=UPI0032660A8F
GSRRMSETGVEEVGRRNTSGDSSSQFDEVSAGNVLAIGAIDVHRKAHEGWGEYRREPFASNGRF